MKFAIFTTTPGPILRTISCPLETVEFQTQEGENIIIISEDTRDDTHYIEENHVATPYPEKPSPFHVFNFSNGSYYDPRTLQDFKDAKWESIKQARTSYLYSPLTTDYGTFTGDEEDQNNLKGAIQLSDKLEAFSQPSDITFTLLDNTRVTLTNLQLNMIGFALGAKTNAAHALSSSLRTQIDDAESVEQLDEIVWTL